MLNPIVTFIFYFGIAITIILSKTWTGLGLFFVVIIILLFINRDQIGKIFKQIKPFILFLPFFIFIYVIISFAFTNSTWLQIIAEAGIAISKLLLLVTVMSVYIISSKDQDLIRALRSIWSNSKLKWKWIDDIFIFLELTLRFYPSFQQEWDAINRSKRALGLKSENSKWEKVKSIANDIPGLIIQSYLKAENTANVMRQRGYGNVVPRGIAQPITFKIRDLMLLIALIIGIIVTNYYAAL